MNPAKPPHTHDAFQRTRGSYYVDIETGRACNLRCVFCFADAGKALNSELSTKEICSVIDQSFDLGVKFIDIVGGGEPFLNKDIMTIIRYIVSKDIVVGIFTNATRLSQNLCDELINLPCYVVAHFNSFDNDVEDYLSGIKGSSEAMRRGLDCLVKAGFAQRGRLGLHTLINRHNIEECERIFIWERDNGIIPFMQLPVLVGRMPHELQVTPIQARDLFYRLAEIDRARYGFQWLPVPPYVSHSCNYRVRGVYIDSIGNVKLCNSTNYVFGNIREKPISEIIGDEAMLAARNLENLKGPCSNCDHLGETCFGGCMAHTYAVTGDLLGSDPRCWHHPSLGNDSRNLQT